LPIVEIKPRDGKVGARLERLFFETGRAPIGVERHNPVALRIADLIGKDRGSAGPCRGAGEERGQSAAVEKIVAQNQARWLTFKKTLRNENGACNSIGLGLLGITDADAPLSAVAEELAKLRKVVRR